MDYVFTYTTQHGRARQDLDVAVCTALRYSMRDSPSTTISGRIIVPITKRARRRNVDGFQRWRGLYASRGKQNLITCTRTLFDSRKFHHSVVGPSRIPCSFNGRPEFSDNTLQFCQTR